MSNSVGLENDGLWYSTGTASFVGSNSSLDTSTFPFVTRFRAAVTFSTLSDGTHPSAIKARFVVANLSGASDCSTSAWRSSSQATRNPSCSFLTCPSLSLTSFSSTYRIWICPSYPAFRSEAVPFSTGIGKEVYWEAASAFSTSSFWLAGVTRTIKFPALDG